MAKTTVPKTRFHKILFDQDSPFKRHQVVEDKKKKNDRKEARKIINKTIQEE
jgi:hypothetical protein